MKLRSGKQTPFKTLTKERSLRPHSLSNPTVPPNLSKNWRVKQDDASVVWKSFSGTKKCSAQRKEAFGRQNQDAAVQESTSFRGFPTVNGESWAKQPRSDCCSVKSPYLNDGSSWLARQAPRQQVRRNGGVRFLINLALRRPISQVRHLQDLSEIKGQDL